jgi:predicted enzyme related to lactoylglutathione lyase
LVEIERTDFVSVPVADMERAKRFYRDTLGMSSPDWDAGFPEIESGNVSLYLVDVSSWGEEFAPHVAPIALRVPDVEAARKRLEEAGVDIHDDIRDTGVCHMTQLKDSEGNALMLHRRYAPPA